MTKKNDDHFAHSAEEFIKHLRNKVASLHKFKKTDRINLITRYPEYQVPSEEDSSSVPIKKVKVEDVLARGYDQELLDRLRHFFDFLKNILKKEKEEIS